MNEEEKYITIKDFIVVVDRTEQSIYKRLKNKNDKLNNYAKKFSKGTKLHIDAIREVYAMELTDEQIFGLIGRVENVEEKVEQVKQLNATMGNEQTKAREVTNNDSKIIEILEREISKKDKIIEDLTLQLADTTKMLDQQQQLSIADKTTILQLQKGMEESKKKKRRSLFDLFKRKQEE